MPEDFLDIPDRGRRTLHIKGYNEGDSELPSASILRVQNSMPKVEIKDNAGEYTTLWLYVFRIISNC